jgi:ribonuclease G
MGGIIVIDFIDQRKHENKRLVHKTLRDEMARDRAKHSILPMSRFGLIEVTRQRVRPEVKIQTEEVCPNCNGTGKQQPSILLDQEIRNNVEYLLGKGNQRKLSLQVNPYVAAFLRNGGLFRSQQWKWFWKHKKWIKIQNDNNAPFMRVKYIDGVGEEIKLD